MTRRRLAARDPEGVIEPYRWEDRVIPVSGQGRPGMEPVDPIVMAAMREHGIVGCGVAFVRDGEIGYAKGFGWAELPARPFLAATASRCGSLAKPVTALCALRLADQGELDVDSPALPILKEIGIVPRPLAGREPDPRLEAIRVRHLMDNTSGLPGGSTYTAWREDRNVAVLHGLAAAATSADVARDALGSARLIAEPGTKYEYANANFVLLARVVEARSGMAFNDYLTQVAMPAFGVGPREVYVSRNQDSADSPARGENEVAYYQTSSERYVSYHPSEGDRGRTWGEAYRGYATEASDGAGGIACSVLGLARLIANLQSAAPALSPRSLSEIRTPPEHTRSEPGFAPETSEYYSKGWRVRYSGGRPWLAHGGMTNHCGGVIGYAAGYQFVAVSNWNNVGAPYVDVLLGRALSAAASRVAR